MNKETDFLKEINKSKIDHKIDLKDEKNNTFGIDRQISGLIYPKNKNEVIKIVNLANKYKIKLYPISRGRNIGYGDKLPVENECFIISMEKMNSIIQLDNEQGYVVLEPGVSQGELYRFLREKKASFWMDSSGAGIDASVIGNCLEGGFGHTPKGNKRKMISDLEIVLANGEIIKTGIFPGAGPDLAGIFVQSNFGIVVSARIELFRKPEHFESFVLQVSNKNSLFGVLNRIRTLKHDGILDSIVHIGNALRTFMTISRFPKNLEKKLVLNSEKAIELMRNRIINPGYWNVAGGIYGSIEEVELKKEIIKKELRQFGKVSFFSDRKIRKLFYFTKLPVLSGIRSVRQARKALMGLLSVHNLMKGIPSNLPLNNILWKTDNYENLGLYWVSPTAELRYEKIEKIIEITERLFGKYEFEMPLTISFVEPSKLVFVYSINFDKISIQERERAKKLYFELNKEFEKNKVSLYRKSIVSMNTNGIDKERLKFLREIKKMVDKHGILSPGRYI